MAATRSAGNLPLGHPAEALFLVPDRNGFIQWPTEQEIQEVSRRLARIVQVGIWSEAKGDYFKSGDLAYQTQQIIRTTAELIKRCQRGKE